MAAHCHLHHPVPGTVPGPGSARARRGLERSPGAAAAVRARHLLGVGLDRTALELLARTRHVREVSVVDGTVRGRLTTAVSGEPVDGVAAG